MKIPKTHITKKTKKLYPTLHMSLTHPIRAIGVQWIAIDRALDEIATGFRPNRDQVYLIIFSKLLNAAHVVFTRRMLWDVISPTGCLTYNTYPSFLTSYNPLIEAKWILKVTRQKNEYDPVKLKVSNRAESFIIRMSKHWLRLSTNKGFQEYVDLIDEFKHYKKQ